MLIPTHDHTETLRFSIAGALAQTVQDLEVFVIGDGAPDVTREVVAEFARKDSRVRYFENPKGRRFGELHRHAATGQLPRCLAARQAGSDHGHGLHERPSLAERGIARQSRAARPSLGYALAEPAIAAARTSISTPARFTRVRRATSPRPGV